MLNFVTVVLVKHTLYIPPKPPKLCYFTKHFKKTFIFHLKANSLINTPQSKLVFPIKAYTNCSLQHKSRSTSQKANKFQYCYRNIT